MPSDNGAILVVGAGLAGLTVAAQLGRHCPVTVVERLPAPGGRAGFESHDIRRLQRECAAAGVRLLLGTTALRWCAGRLLVVGPPHTEWLAGQWLVFAGGTRPATPAELGLVGGRLAGVFSATVAHHLLEAGVVLGRRPVLVGTGHWAEAVLPELARSAMCIEIIGAAIPHEAGQSSTVGEADYRTSSGDAVSLRRWPRYRAIEVHGSDRVNRVRISNGCIEHQLSCDAVILAGQLRPLRNVDGAVRDCAPRVSFVQPDDTGMNAESVIHLARAQASCIAESIGRAP